MKIVRLLAACVLVIAGCATQEVSKCAVVNMGGRHMSYVGDRRAVENAIAKYNLNVWDVGSDIYAEGRTYGMNFAEYATSADLLDGVATDGCQKSPNATRRR